MEVIIIDMDTDLQRAITDAGTPNDERKVVRFYILDNLRGKYITSDGRCVVISSKTADKYTNKANKIKLRAGQHLDTMLLRSKLINIVDVVHDSFEKFAYYETCFEIDGEKYVGMLNVGITSENESILYDLKPFKEY